MVIKTRFRRFLADESAATAMEYGIIGAIMGLGAIAAANGVGAGLNNLLAYVAAGFGGH